MHQHDLGTLDIVVIAKSGAAQAPNAELRAELDGLWGRLVQKC